MANLQDLDIECLVKNIQDAVVYDDEDDYILLLYTYEDYYHRSEEEIAVINELKARGLKVKTRLVAKRGPVRKNTEPWYLDIPMPDWYRDEIIYTK